MNSNLPGIHNNTLVVIYDAPAGHIDFQSGVADDVFSSATCSLFGDAESIGIKACVRQSSGLGGSIDAGK
jgi:hypothetical protein